MINISKIFGVFEDFEQVVERVNPSHDLPIVDFSLKESGDGWKDQLWSHKSQTLRYILVKLVEKRLDRDDIFGGENPFTDEVIPPMENPPKTVVEGKHWEKASYIIRFSSGYTHLGIAGSIMEALKEKIPKCKLCLRQSGHGEPATIAMTEKLYNYATVVGAGFVKINSDKKEMIFYGRSRAFTVRYDSQVKYYLGMTGHEFVAKILRSELPKGWNIIVINNDVEASVTDGYETIPNPE